LLLLDFLLMFSSLTLIVFLWKLFILINAILLPLKNKMNAVASNSVNSVKDTQSSNPSQWLGLIVSLSNTRLLMEEMLLLLHQLSDANS